jgi:uncharacterized membrane protein
MKFDQTQFFLLIILIFLVLLFISSPTFFLQDDVNMEKENVDFSCLKENQEIVDKKLDNIDKAIEISRDTSMSFYEYLKRLDESNLQEPYDIRTVEFWLENKDKKH